MSPVLLLPNQPPARMYRGGAQIAAFRAAAAATPPPPPPSSSSPLPDNNHHHHHHHHEHDSPNNTATTSPNEPEDWIASTTCCANSSILGLSHLPDGRSLASAIASSPDHWLGPHHVAAFGPDNTKLLVKLLDAGQRLPVHAHPSKGWVEEHLVSASMAMATEATAGTKKKLEKQRPPYCCGKAELWYVLRGGTVWLGLKEGMAREALRDLVVDGQRDVGGTLLPRMHELQVREGQAVFVPPGVLHAIGEGLLIAEVQEPSDWSVLCEWEGFEVDGLRDGHLGVGFDVALTAVEVRGRSVGEIEGLVEDAGVVGVVCEELTRGYFRVIRCEVDGRVELEEVGFAVVIVLEGRMKVRSSGDGGGSGSSEVEAMEVRKGSTLVVAYGDGNIVLEGKGAVVIARPPQT